jgi:hypothetical protein
VATSFTLPVKAASGFVSGQKVTSTLNRTSKAEV